MIYSYISKSIQLNVLDTDLIQDEKLSNKKITISWNVSASTYSKAKKTKLIPKLMRKNIADESKIILDKGIINLYFKLNLK